MLKNAIAVIISTLMLSIFTVLAEPAKSAKQAIP
jgi:hypothetical protein